MSWRNELISSRKEALDFFPRALAQQGIDTNISLKSAFDPRGKTRHFKLVAMDKSKEPSERSVVFGAEFHVNPYIHNLVISNYVVAPAYYYDKSADPYGGKEVGLIGLKTIMGFANGYANPIVNIHLRKIQGDGSSFWPYLGAMPSAGVTIPNNLNRLLLQQLSYHEGEEFQPLHEIAELAINYPTLAYRELAQTRHNPFKRTNNDKVGYICRRVLKDVFKGTCSDNMTINLRDESTREILSARLGALPLEPTPPYPSWGRFSEVALETAKRSKNTKFITDFENYREKTWREYPLSMAGAAIPWNL